MEAATVGVAAVAGVVGVAETAGVGATSGAFSAGCDGLVGFVSSDIAVRLFLVVSQNPHAHLLLTADLHASEVLRSLAFVINVTLRLCAKASVIPSDWPQCFFAIRFRIARPGVEEP